MSPPTNSTSLGLSRSNPWLEGLLFCVSHSPTPLWGSPRAQGGEWKGLGCPHPKPDLGLLSSDRAGRSGFLGDGSENSLCKRARSNSSLEKSWSPAGQHPSLFPNPLHAPLSLPHSLSRGASSGWGVVCVDRGPLRRVGDSPGWKGGHPHVSPRSRTGARESGGGGQAGAG